MKQDIQLSPSAGQDILAVSDFELSPVNSRLINCSITINNEQSYDLFISVHSGGITLEN